MRTKILPALLSVFLLLLYSCSKIISEKPAIVQTTTRDIVSGSNSIPLSAATVIALRFLQSKNLNEVISLKNAQTIVKNGVPYFHIINANKGFVILSPDSAYSALLAYDNLGNFSFADKDLNPGLILWFNKHAHELDYIRNNKNNYLDSITKANKILWRALNNIDFTTANLNSPNAVKPITTPLCICGGGLPGDPPTLISSVPAYNYTVSKVGPLCTTFWD